MDIRQIGSCSSASENLRGTGQTTVGQTVNGDMSSGQMGYIVDGLSTNGFSLPSSVCAVLNAGDNVQSTVNKSAAGLGAHGDVQCDHDGERHALRLKGERHRNVDQAAMSAGSDADRDVKGEGGGLRFSVGAALHACGSASDMTITQCIQAGACMVVCPCCIGKLASDKEIRSEVRISLQCVAFRQRLQTPSDDVLKSCSCNGRRNDPRDEFVLRFISISLYLLYHARALPFSLSP